MALTRSAFKGVEQRAAASDTTGTGAGGAFPVGPEGIVPDAAKTTGAGKGKKRLSRPKGKVAAASPALTEGGGALGHTGGGPK